MTPQMNINGLCYWIKVLAQISAVAFLMDETLEETHPFVEETGIQFSLI